MKNLEFKQLLKEGIDSVANRQRKKVRAIEEEMGGGLHITRCSAGNGALCPTI